MSTGSGAGQHDRPHDFPTIAKRAEIAGMIAELEEELNQCRADLTHIGGALRLLSANLDSAAILPRQHRYKRTQYFGRNELSRLCMETLRLAAGHPLTAEEITLCIIAAKGFDARDARLRAAARVQVGAALKRLNRKQIATPAGKGVGET